VSDLSDIVAIDVHTHVSTSVKAPPPEASSEGAAAMARYFHTEARAATTVPDIAAYTASGR